MIDPDDHRHGTDNAYTNLKCRCQPCRTAHATAERPRQAKQNARVQALLDREELLQSTLRAQRLRALREVNPGLRKALLASLVPIEAVVGKTPARGRTT